MLNRSAQNRLLDGGDSCFDICISHFRERDLTEKVESLTIEFFENVEFSGNFAFLIYVHTNHETGRIMSKSLC